MTTRALVVSVVAGIAILGDAAGYVAVPSPRLFEPEVRIQNEDYVETRRHFRTRLLRAGASPQREVIARRRPEYVDEVEFPSGALRSEGVDQWSAQPTVDSTHIYLAGHSAGGTLTLLAVEASGRFRAAASFDGSPDQQLLYNGSATKPGTHREVVFDPTDSRELQVRSPLA